MADCRYITRANQDSIHNSNFSLDRAPSTLPQHLGSICMDCLHRWAKGERPWKGKYVVDCYKDKDTGLLIRRNDAAKTLKFELWLRGSRTGSKFHTIEQAIAYCNGYRRGWLDLQRQVQLSFGIID